ncbi:MAG: class I SAM-dependent methyltransferase [Candidatus Thermoplasmatota archaeon]|jgi:predicted SAM-dependent methyltransferase
MDVAALPGVEVVHDAFAFPWPFADAEFDRILCRHILEHVPHEVGIRPYRDGFLVFLEECHRLLRPGGLLEIVTPHPDSANTIADPTHTRVVHPRNFDCLNPDREYEFRHYTKARFRVIDSSVQAFEVLAPEFLPLGKSRLGLTTHLVLRLPALRGILRGRPMEQRFVLEKA